MSLFMLVCLSSTILPLSPCWKPQICLLVLVSKSLGYQLKSLGWEGMASTAPSVGMLNPTPLHPHTPSPSCLRRLLYGSGSNALPPSIQSGPHSFPLGRVFFPLQPVLGSSRALEPPPRAQRIGNPGSATHTPMFPPRWGHRNIWE